MATTEDDILALLERKGYRPNDKLTQTDAKEEFQLEFNTLRYRCHS